MVKRPSRRWSWTRTAASLLVLDLAAMPTSARDADPVPPPATVQPRDRLVGEDLYLEVVLNGSTTERLVHFTRRGEALCATATDLRGLGFVLPPGDDERCLPDIPGLHYTYDVGQQRVTVDAPLNQLNLPRQLLNKTERSSTPPTSGTGVLLNYDIYAAE